MSIAAKMYYAAFCAAVSVSPAAQDAGQQKGDIILRVLIGMAFIMTLMWLAAVVAGKVGSRFHPGGWFAEQDAKEQNAENENENNDIGGNING